MFIVKYQYIGTSLRLKSFDTYNDAHKFYLELEATTGLVKCELTS